MIGQPGKEGDPSGRKSVQGDPAGAWIGKGVDTSSLIPKGDYRGLGGPTDSHFDSPPLRSCFRSKCEEDSGFFLLCRFAVRGKCLSLGF